jgi:hypothetical protein
MGATGPPFPLLHFIQVLPRPILSQICIDVELYFDVHAINEARIKERALEGLLRRGGIEHGRVYWRAFAMEKLES